MPRCLCLLLILLASCQVTAAEPVAAPTDYDATIRGILKAKCVECHGPDTQEAGISFAELTDSRMALQKRPLWKRSLVRVVAKQMPPDDSPQLTAVERQQLTGWMKFAVEHVDCDPRGRDPGPALLRRLNKTEYQTTLYDLLGLDFAAADAVGIPDDGTVDGFDNQATALGMTTPLVEKYFAAADAAIAFLWNDPLEPSQPQRKRFIKSNRGQSQPEIDKMRRAAYDRLMNVMGEGSNDRERAQEIITRFVSRAYRRIATPEELAPLLALFDQRQASGASFETAVRSMLKPVLVSPPFLFRLETDRAAADGRLGVPVAPYELATRLSYFLGSTMPDEELFASAATGALVQTAELERQTTRLLASSFARGLTDQFAAQWLQLGKLADARPQSEFFPTFTPKLREAMRNETLAYFDALRTEDRSLLELLDADSVFVNAELAQHYGLEPVKGDELRRVAVRPEHHRGGILGMGSVLALTSHTFRTSPTQRGKYILEVVLGSPPPPPPANAGQLKDDNKNKRRSPQTFREQLQQHATQKSCAACHQKLDPLGFALDNYDAIGAWRDSTVDVPLDVTGVLPDGEKLDGAGGLKRVLLARKDEFIRNLVEKMLSYALGRELDYYDECTIREISERVVRHDYRFSSLVQGIVQSPTFRERRAVTPPAK